MLCGFKRGEAEMPESLRTNENINVFVSSWVLFYRTFRRNYLLLHMPAARAARCVEHIVFRLRKSGDATALLLCLRTDLCGFHVLGLATEGTRISAVGRKKNRYGTCSCDGLMWLKVM